MWTLSGSKKFALAAEKHDQIAPKAFIIKVQMSTMTNGRHAPPPLAASTSSTTAWTVHDASELYEVPRWSNGYFSINGEGHVQVHPTREPARAIDLKELVDLLQLRG